MNPYSKFHNRDGTPSPTEPIEASNPPAITALILGITSVALIPVTVFALWMRLGDVQLDTWTVIVYLISLVVAICAALFGVQGKRFAKVGAPGRVTAHHRAGARTRLHRRHGRRRHRLVERLPEHHQP